MENGTQWSNVEYVNRVLAWVEGLSGAEVRVHTMLKGRSYKESANG
jgi:hypothetical protein